MDFEQPPHVSVGDRLHLRVAQLGQGSVNQACRLGRVAAALRSPNSTGLFDLAAWRASSRPALFLRNDASECGTVIEAKALEDCPLQGAPQHPAQR